MDDHSTPDPAPDPVAGDKVWRMEFAFGRLPRHRRLWRRVRGKPEHDRGPSDWHEISRDDPAT